MHEPFVLYGGRIDPGKGCEELLEYFQTYIKEYIPEFEQQSGIKVNLDLQAFPVYNQRMDLELSTSGWFTCAGMKGAGVPL